MKRWKSVFAGAVALGGAAACATAGAADRKAEAGISGDGVLFRTFVVPSLVRLFVPCGHGVSFAEFPAGGEWEAEYGFSGFPGTPEGFDDESWKCAVYLSAGAESDLAEGWRAEFTLSNAAGEVLAECGGEGWEPWPFMQVRQALPKGKCWAGTMREHRHEPGCVLKRDEAYRLKVHYWPGASPENGAARAHFEIRQDPRP